MNCYQTQFQLLAFIKYKQSNSTWWVTTKHFYEKEVGNLCKGLKALKHFHYRTEHDKIRNYKSTNANCTWLVLK